MHCQNAMYHNSIVERSLSDEPPKMQFYTGGTTISIVLLKIIQGR